MRNKFADLHAHYFGRRSTLGGIQMVLGMSPAPRSIIRDYWNIPYPRPRNVLPVGSVRNLRNLARYEGKPDNHYLYLLGGDRAGQDDATS